MSEITELVIDGELMAIKLRSLPKLESLIGMDANILLFSELSRSS
jgi:hypothetical protein